ncbi:glycine zipper family protein [Noviherbaspirillum massiliense]|uniref:glycine zipper family protein n=1 Tax=Noviherbaspirillum massiliense TaxID=1465823 RepID=UPI0002EAE94C|nr:glycine zipper family protein [Noviherbaspirillum massiliense]
MKTDKLYTLSALAFALVLCACTTAPPNEPSVLVLPGTGKSFEQFRADNEVCKQFAFEQVGGNSPNNVAVDSGVRSAAVGTLLGAAAGAAINGGRGASVGAGTGLAFGGLAGAGAGETSSSRLQQRYDFGYQQCMYAKGHRVPMTGSFRNEFLNSQRERSAYPPPPPPPGPVLR